MIYLDNAATTRMAPETIEAMLPYFGGQFGNPSSAHRAGAEAKRVLSECREQIASMLKVRPDEIYFTSGGTEADNQALICAFESFPGRRRIVTSRIEHPAVLNTCEYLRSRGAEISWLECDSDGCVVPDIDAVTPAEDTALVSLMYANNEVGTLQPAGELAAICAERGILFHTDAVQAFGHIPLDLSVLPVSMLSASAHKFGGPKGTGFLFIRHGVPIPALLHGGSQERNRRAGTENVPGIAGMKKAAELAERDMIKTAERVRTLRDMLQDRILAGIPDTRVNGSPSGRLPGILNVTFGGVSAESLLILLDLEGICVSAGSACSSGSIHPSHVLTAMGISREDAFRSLRFSLSGDTTAKEIEETVSCLKRSVRRLRAMTSLS